MGISFKLSLQLTLLPYPRSLSGIFIQKYFYKYVGQWRVFACVYTYCLYKVNRCKYLFTILPLFSSASISLLTPLCLRTLGDICLTQHTTPPYLSTHTHTPAGRPSPRSGSAAEKVTGWATIKRVRARTSFVIATRDADRELLSSVNDKSMKFPSCSGCTHEAAHGRTTAVISRSRSGVSRLR